MSGHADTIRNFIHDDSRCVPADIPEFQAQGEADAALDALVTENQRLCDALYFGIETCNQPDSLPTMRQCGEFVIAARAALAGTPSEDTE